MRFSLGAKINIIVFIVVCSLGTTLGMVFVNKEIQLLSSELDLRANFAGKLLALSIENDLKDNDSEALYKALKSAALGEENAYVLVKSLDGEIKAAYWKKNVKSNVTEQSFPLRTSSDPMHQHQTELFGAVDRVSEGKQIGTLAIGTDHSSLNAKRKSLIFKTSILVLSASLLAMFLGFFFIRLLLRKSISPLLNGIRELGSGNLGFRINSKQHDELGDISNAVDGMANKLASSLVTKQALETTIEIRTAELQKLLTEKMQAETALRGLAESLEKKVEDRTIALSSANRELEAFCYSVSHDLRAPLRGVDGFSHILLEEYAGMLDEKGQDCIHRIHKGCARMARLIDELLELSRITRSEVNRTRIDLCRMAEEIIQNLRQNEPGRAVGFRMESGMTVNADLTLTRSVLENLLGNAWKYTRNTPNPFIQFYVSKENGTRTYCIKDNGAGFNMEYADKLYTPFHRLHRSEDFEGTGIGLASVQRIILRHGGTIRAEGEEGKGAVFYFTFGDDGYEIQIDSSDSKTTRMSLT